MVRMIITFLPSFSRKVKSKSSQSVTCRDFPSQNSTFQVTATLVVHEGDDQEDHEEDDSWADIKHDNPLLDIDCDPLLDPFDEVDDESPAAPPPLPLQLPPSLPPPPPAKHCKPATIDDFDGLELQKGSHHHCAAKYKEKIAKEG
ncbi:hypothetical protein B0H14DRAFT_2656973 [Mycena olivaceomarginata]|nr:hypothetical protein B0H14DRAFT_2656973 [Mycena olivaceomarginata]